MIKAVTDDSFEGDVLNAPGPVLVDFWAEWCGPCKAISPSLEEISKSLDGRLTIVKVNIDENPRTPQQYNVRGIPNLVLFKGGQVADTRMGVMPKAKLQEWLEGAI